MSKVNYIKIGKIIGLISGVIIIINGILRTTGGGFGPFNPLGALGGLVSGIVAILAGLIMIAIYVDKIKISDSMMLFIAYLVLGLISGCVTALLAALVVLLGIVIK